MSAASAAAVKKETTKETEPAPSLLSQVRKGIQHSPPRIFIYGIHGIGKSTFAAQAPRPIMIPTEDGADEIAIDKFPRATSSDAVLLALRSLYKEPHEYKTVIIDSADWLGDAIIQELHSKHTSQELSYGKDTVLAAQRVGDLLVALNYLREKRGMSAIVVAHSEVKRFDSPLTEPYDRYQPKLQRGMSAIFQEWADAVLFATYDVHVQREEVGFNQQVRRGISTGDRIIYTEERPAFLAKNRYRLPFELPLEFDKMAEHIPYFQHAAAKAKGE